MNQNGKPETRVVYGEKCTWWGPVQDAALTEDYIPICPECKGTLLQVDSEEDFFIAIHNYQNGFGPGRKRLRKHPGYVDFMRWLKRRCFMSAFLAAKVYFNETGIDLKLDPKEFGVTNGPSER